MSDQDKLLDFVNDPENLKKAVESSMEKRQKIIDQASDQTIEQRLDRIEVIDETGRVYVKGAIYGTPVDIHLSYQDDGRTLKVFVTPKEKR